MSNDARQLRIYTLGGLKVVWGGSEVPAREWNRKRAAELFRLLIESPNFRLHGQRAEARLWPDSDRDAARTNLRVKLFDLRAILAAYAPEGVDPRKAPPVLYEAGILSLNPLYTPWVDAHAFEAAAFDALDAAASGRGEALALTEAALALWTGEYLDGEMESAGGAASRYSGLRRELALRLVDLAGRSPLSERELEACFEDYPWDEQIADALVRYLVREGRRSRAHEVFLRHDAAARDSIGVPASKQLATLVGRAPAAPAPARIGVNRLVGRDSELRVAEAALQSLQTTNHAALEIYGSRGSGKTRLLDEIGDIAQRVGLVPILAKAYKGCTEETIRQQLLHGIWRFRIGGDGEVPEDTETWEAFLRLAARVNENAAIVVMIDDADFIDENAFSRIEAVLQKAGGRSMLVTTQHWSRRRNHNRSFSINLRPLGLDESIQVVEDSFVAPVAAQLSRQIAELWPGELSILTSSAQNVQATSTGILEDGTWVLRPEAGAADLLSFEARAAIQRRISELQESDLAVLEAITVVGRHPSISVVSSMQGLSEGLLAVSLKSLEVADLITRDANGINLPTAVRVIVNESMKRSRRRDLGERAAKLRVQRGEVPSPAQTRP
jgi:DNA-binding SARP family transcriptional activator